MRNAILGNDLKTEPQENSEMQPIVFNVFSVMFAKTSLLFCCSCNRLFVTNYVCIVSYVRGTLGFKVLRYFDNRNLTCGIAVS